jgi:hypothetical protein
MLPKVFVSFDYSDDKHYKYLLQAWHSNPKFNFVFEDGTPQEIDSFNVGRIKAALTMKIKDATHTLVIVGENANALHRKHDLIGQRNWINYEVAKSIELKKRIAVIKLKPHYALPERLVGVNASCEYGFTEDNVTRALNSAPYIF